MFRDVIFTKLSLVFQFPVVFYAVENKYINTIGQNYTGGLRLDVWTLSVLNNRYILDFKMILSMSHSYFSTRTLPVSLGFFIFSRNKNHEPKKKYV